MIKVKKDLTGLVFGRLKVINQAEDVFYSGGVKSAWNCICQCGKKVVRTGNILTRGDSKSCGCLNSDSLSERSTSNTVKFLYKGIDKKHKLYSVYHQMIRRCYSENSSQYEDYGGRGLTVCDRWLQKFGKGFENFVCDMYPSYLDGLSIDRIDVNLGYSPENCKWSDSSEQNWNQRMKKTNTTGKTGVSLHRTSGLYLAKIGFKGINHILGYFVTFEEAVEARELAEIKFYGKLKGH